jgi:hypothetical protein
VAAVVDECGFAVEVEMTVQLARGQAAVDVHAVENIGGRTHRIFCECKLWSRTVAPTSICDHV